MGIVSRECLRNIPLDSNSGYTDRWFIAMGNPNKFKDKADAVQEAVVQIKMRCEELLSENMHKVKMLNIGEVL